MKLDVKVIISENVPMNPENVMKIHDSIERRYGVEVSEVQRLNLPPIMDGKAQKAMAARLLAEAKENEVLYIASAWACPILVATLTHEIKETGKQIRVLVQDNGDVMELAKGLPIC